MIGDELLYKLYCRTAKKYTANTAFSDTHICSYSSHMQIQSQGAVLVIRARLHNYVLRVMGHGFPNKWLETAVSMWTQEMRDFDLTFYLNPTSGLFFSDAKRTFCLKVLGKGCTLFTENYKCSIWLKGPTPWEIFNTFILKV